MRLFIVRVVVVVVVANVVANVVAIPRHRSRANKPYSAGVVIHDF